MTTTLLRNRLKAAALAAMACIMISPLTTRAEVTYRLVTSDDQVIDHCVYIIAAADRDIAASKTMASPSGMVTTGIIRDGDQVIITDDNTAEFLLRHVNNICQCAGDHKDHTWSFSLNKGNSYGYLTHYKNGWRFENSSESLGQPSSNRLYHYVTTISIDPVTSNCATEYYNSSRDLRYGLSFNDNTLNTHSPDTDGLSGIQLYRKDAYNIHVTGITRLASGEHRIGVHIDTYDSGEYAKGSLMYLFSNDERMTNDEIYHADGVVKKDNYADGDLEVTAPADKKYLWLVRDHGSNYNETDAIRIEIKETTPTAIETIETGDDGNATAVYYTLQGIRLQAAPTAAGIYLRKSATGRTQKIVIR